MEVVLVVSLAIIGISSAIVAAIQVAKFGDQIRRRRRSSKDYDFDAWDD